MLFVDYPQRNTSIFFELRGNISICSVSLGYMHFKRKHCQALERVFLWVLKFLIVLVVRSYLFPSQSQISMSQMGGVCILKGNYCQAVKRVFSWGLKILIVLVVRSYLLPKSNSNYLVMSHMGGACLVSSCKSCFLTFPPEVFLTFSSVSSHFNSPSSF